MRRLKVNRRDLIFALDNRVRGVANYLDTETGDVIPVFSYNRDQILDAVRETPDRYLRLAPQTGGQAYQAMAGFTATVSRPELRGQLEAALASPARFRLFREVVEANPVESRRWQNYRAEMLIEVVRAKLAARQIELLAQPAD
jgi:hypothetical protein